MIAAAVRIAADRAQKIGSISHGLRGSNMSVEHAARKGMLVRCQCAVCACDKRTSARRSTVCKFCEADTHRTGPRGLSARQLFR